MQENERTPTPLPVDHKTRMKRALLALDGLSIGDAFGANVFAGEPESLHRRSDLPKGPWGYTDDTVMAMGIVEVLYSYGHIDQDELSNVFSRRYWDDVNRGYGPNAHKIFEAVRSGVPWRTAATTRFGEEYTNVFTRLRSWLGLHAPDSPHRSRGSLGNGGAMRVAPVGGYFAEDDWSEIVKQAGASAQVTHAHPDGMAGAIAVAVAAAWAWRYGNGLVEHTPEKFLDHILEYTPNGQTHDRLMQARTLPTNTTPNEAACKLGNGNPILSAETVPFTLWCAARHLRSFEDAIWATFSVGGDIDTTCAIVGGIVALSGGPASIPVEWLESREPLDLPF